MMETDTEGVATCGMRSAEESRGEGLPEDHGRARALPATCLQPRARTHLGGELVHRLPELIEVGFQLIMLQQGGRVGHRLGEVGYHGHDGDLAPPILLQAARLQAKAGHVPGLPLPGEGHG